MKNIVYGLLKVAYRLARKTGRPKLCFAVYRLAVRFEE